ncbi:MAG TPA: metallopeptidase family protein [Polyangia bacterium]|jgi:predicted Zn-dependent protease with MMP-like domain/predicted nucleic acid-binding protein|nr:metallopeptidase family protein [Polyangia bacterium]
MNDSETTTQDSDGATDAAWEALESGDIASARRQAARLDAESPDTLLLLAACAREENDGPGALETLRRAAKADPDWATPELWIAELLATEPETMEEARRHAERALDLADEEEEYLSALALKAGLEIEAGDLDEARRTLADLPPPDVALGDLEIAIEIAELHQAVGQASVAVERMRTLTAANPDVADAWYALGCAAAELDDDDQMRAAWKRAWTLDAAPHEDDSEDDEEKLDEATIEKTAEEALGELPERARALLRDVPIIIAERPAEADVDTGLDPRALGLFTGTAYPDMPNVGGQPGLTQIVLFRSNLERVAQDEDELLEEIRVTLLHETGHFFGLDEDELEGAGLG